MLFAYTTYHNALQSRRENWFVIRRRRNRYLA